MDIASVVYIPAEQWDTIRGLFEDGQLSDNDVIDFATLFGETLLVEM